MDSRCTILAVKNVDLAADSLAGVSEDGVRFDRLQRVPALGDPGTLDQPLGHLGNW